MKGLLDGAILGLISQGETYGYEITKKLEAHKFPDISEGGIYRVFLSLSKKGYVNTRMVMSDSGGPKRKYYAFSYTGKAERKVFKYKWIELNDGMNSRIRGE